MSPTNCSLQEFCNRTSPTGNDSTDLPFSSPFPILNDPSVSCAPANSRSQTTTIVVMKALIMVTIMLAAVLGNLLVIVSVLRFDRLRLIANTFIVSLALTDLLVACLVMPFSASKELAGRWLHGQLACDVFNANDVLFSTASLLHLCCISVDRYIAITDPLRYEDRLTCRRVAAMLGVVWVASTVISHLPIHCGWYTTEEQLNITQSCSGDTQCSFEVNKVYGVISSTVSFWTPAIIMVFAYKKIYDEALKQEKSIESMTALSSRETSTDRLDDRVLRPPADTYRTLGRSLERNLNSISADRNIGRNLEREVNFNPNGNIQYNLAGSVDRILDRSLYRNIDRTSFDRQFDQNLDRNLNRSLNGGLDRNLNRSLDQTSFDRNVNENLLRTSYDRHMDRNACQHRRKMRREHKAAKTLGVIMGAFLCCWLPFFTWYLTTALCGNWCYTPHPVEATLFWIGYLSSALNPIIYALLNRDFRDAFRRLLSCGARPSSVSLANGTTDFRKTVTTSQEEIYLR